MAAKFGLERLGYLCLKHPWISLIFLAVLSAAALAGMTRISVDDSLSELFRADTPEFRQYERLSSRFPSSEYDVLAVVEGKDLLTREGLEKFRSLVTELHFAAGVKGILSMFSAREPLNEQGYPPPLFPADLPEGAEFGKLIQRARANEVIKGKFLSDDGLLSVIVMGLDRKLVAEQGLKHVIGDIQRTLQEQLAGSGLRAALSGVPVMQLEIRNAVQHDRLLYNGLGFALGALICLMVLRRLSFMLIAAAAPALAIVWALGLFGLFDVRLNLFLNVITPLIMVISFSDAMHMVFGVRRRLMAGESADEAARSSVDRVGPAALLSMLTNAAAFISLIFSDSALIRTFGIAGILSVVIVFFAVITVVPTLSVLLLRHSAVASRGFKQHDWAMNRLDALSAALAAHLYRRAALYTLSAILIAAGLGWVYLKLEPQYRLADQVPDREQAVAASSRIDQKLTGANPVHILIEWKDGRPLYEPQRLEAIGRVHRIVEEQAGLGNVWSLEGLRRWLAEAGQTGPQVLKKYVELLPDHLTRRFVTAEGDAVVVTGRVPDIDASQILPLVRRLDQALNAVRQQNPELTISVTGLPAIAARNSAEMIRQLNYGLFGDIATAIVIIGIAFRSALTGLFGIIPNLLPILAAGAVLYWTGAGLQFASIVALTVAFGLAIDNIVHFLYRLRIEEDSAPGRAGAVKRTLTTLGPVILLTTLVLVAGLSLPVLSDLPSLRLFGMLCALTLLVALTGALIVLPASIFLVARFRKGQSSPLAQPGCRTPPSGPAPSGELRTSQA